MRIAILSPTSASSENVCGAAVTAARLADSLKNSDEVLLVDVSAAEDTAEVMTELAQFNPDVVHLVDAWNSGRLLEDPVPNFPLILSMPGTDIHYDIFAEDRTAVVQRVMRAARVIVASSEPAAEVIRGTMKDLAERVRVVPQGVRLAEDSYELRRELGLKMAQLVLFLPGPLCTHKNQGIAIAALDGLVEDHPNVRLVLAGAVVDDGYGAQIAEAVKARDWCHHVEHIPHASMGAAYADSDIVLNTSMAEGGSNSVLEAMSCGRPVVVSAVAGNLGLVTSGEQGLTYDPASIEELQKALGELIEDASLRQKLGGKGNRIATEKHSPEKEAEALRKIYEEWKGR